MFRRADVALYRAKADTGSASRFFDPEMDRLLLERDNLEHELRLAIASRDIRPFFQPLVELQTGKIIGFEALARWTHASMGPIPPERFIPVADETGQLPELTDQLFREACQAAVAWPSDTTLAFNISPSQLKDRTLGLRILRILGETGMLPHRLEIEITESALVQDLEAAQANLGALRNVGVRIALDDFGTGYSSLYHLRNFKIDKIKIDRSFIETMGSEKESLEIVTALFGLGQGLGLTITAEGIEGQKQEDDLRSIGIQEGQGFLFGLAVPATETAAFFALPAADTRRA